MAAQELKSVVDLLNETVDKLKEPPSNIEMLKFSIDLVKKSQEGIANVVFTIVFFD